MPYYSRQGSGLTCVILINIPRSFVGRLLQVFCSGRGSVVVVAVACRGPERVYVLAACGVFILDCLSELWGGRAETGWIASEFRYSGVELREGLLVSSSVTEAWIRGFRRWSPGPTNL